MTSVKPQHTGLPETALRITRKPGAWYMRRKWDIHVQGAELVPETGPVIFASNHIGWFDGPVLVATCPRTVHALVKAEEFTGNSARVLRALGQIAVRRQGTDAHAMRAAIAALAREQAILMFPEGTRGNGKVRTIHAGIGYLAIVSGAPIVPVALLGTRIPGEDIEARPEKGRRIEIHYGRSFWFAPVEPPRKKSDIATATNEVHNRLRKHVSSVVKGSALKLPQGRQ